VVAFKGYQLKISDSDGSKAILDIRVLPTPSLFGHDSPIAWAELQWRVSLPLLVPILVAIALPLSRVNPRQGRFIKMLPGILLYLLYLTLLTSGRSMLEEGEALPAWVGLWWVHGLFALVAVLLNKWPGWRLAWGQKRAAQREALCA
jgi:lipopolysaccharide export system permease protein